MGMDQSRMEMNQYREEIGRDRVEMNQCRVNMDQVQANKNQLQVNVERSCGRIDQTQVDMGNSGGDIDQLQMSLGQFQAAKVRRRVANNRLRVKQNLHRADSDRLPKIALKPGSSSVDFVLGAFHLEQCQQKVIDPEITGSEVIRPAAISLHTTGLEAMGLETISLEAELPEVLFDGMRAFIAANPSWDQYSLITSALACFLFQNGCSDNCVTQHYIDSLFSRN